MKGLSARSINSMCHQPHGSFPGSAQTHELAHNKIWNAGAIRMCLAESLCPPLILALAHNQN